MFLSFVFTWELLFILGRENCGREGACTYGSTCAGRVENRMAVLNTCTTLVGFLVHTLEMAYFQADK